MEIYMYMYHISLPPGIYDLLNSKAKEVQKV